MKTASPSCDAVIVHDPSPVMCTVVPETVHRPLAANDTSKPESDVALTLKSGSLMDLLGSGLKVIA